MGTVGILGTVVLPPPVLETFYTALECDKSAGKINLVRLNLDEIRNMERIFGDTYLSFANFYYTENAVYVGFGRKKRLSGNVFTRSFEHLDNFLKFTKRSNVTIIKYDSTGRFPQFITENDEVYIALMY